VVIASILRSEGHTGVHTHIRELMAYMAAKHLSCELVTSFSWLRKVPSVMFAPRALLRHAVPSASVLWYRYSHRLLLAKALRLRLAQGQPAIVYAQGPEAARAALNARQGPHQKVVMAVHYLGSQARGWVYKGLIQAGGRAELRIGSFEREVMRDLDGIVYVSEAAREEMVRNFADAGKVRSEVVPNFVTAFECSSDMVKVADLVTIGALERVKNHEFILQVIASAKAMGHLYSLDVFGVGPLRHYLQRVARDLGVAGEVRFCGYDPRVRSKLSSYRAYVHASREEAGPVAVIEALSAGLPVIGVGSGGTSELFSDGIEGRYWPSDDPVAAARVLIDCLEDKEALHAFSRAAVARFRRCFESEVVVPRLIRFLATCAGATYDKNQDADATATAGGKS
jgi:glycosyltransferase involved in cell wall biosynthesis